MRSALLSADILQARAVILFAKLHCVLGAILHLCVTIDMLPP